MGIAIVWFRRDLRLADNPALAAAAEAHEAVLPVYLHAPEALGASAPGAASRWWLHHSLAALDASLQGHRGGLHIRRGESASALLALARTSGAVAVYFNRDYDPAERRRDAAVSLALEEAGIQVHGFQAALWAEPWSTLTQQGEPYRVFTPFWRKLRTRIDQTPPLPAPGGLSIAHADGGESIASLRLLPTLPWAEGFQEHWTPGEQGAADMLDLFIDDALGHYVEGRDRPGRHGTSRLSPHLHFGETSPRLIAARLRDSAARPTARVRPDLEPFLRQLGWREFAHHLLYHFPTTPVANFNPRFDRFPWAPHDDAMVQAWQQGRTGIPIIDAGMRELWATGWMHNRVRMLVASFLTKNLRQHWHIGARLFWDTLVDADLANNTMGWQWVAGSGADAAPYFRIFNPVTQGLKFDAAGAYIQRWVPALAGASGRLVHMPWEDAAFLAASGYPPPMVDLKTSREEALVAYRKTRDP
jgi:deoxyribodipyrimidine photo-lyase